MLCYIAVCVLGERLTLLLVHVTFVTGTKLGENPKFKEQGDEETSPSGDTCSGDVSKMGIPPHVWVDTYTLSR